MKSKFGKRTGYEESGSTMNIIKNVVGFFLLLALLALIIAVLLSPNFAPIGALGMGVLGDPFKTTRKMKVPFHARKGHRERTFTTFAQILISTVVFITIVGTVAVLAR